MLTRPMDILSAFPVRKSKQQKQEFRDAAQSYLKQFGYSPTVEKGSFGCRNMVIGDPETAQYLITAHYDTCARLPIPNLITPCNFWAFLGYQLVVMLLMLLVPAIPGALAGLLAGSFDVGYYVWFLCVWVMIALVMILPTSTTPTTIPPAWSRCWKSPVPCRKASGARSALSCSIWKKQG